jgi:hypothetical protein
MSPLEREGGEDQGERMCDLVAGAGLEGLEKIGRKDPAQRVSAEGARRHANQSASSAERAEESGAQVRADAAWRQHRPG